MKNPLFYLFLVLPLLFSCVNTKKATYFNKLKNNTTFNAIQIPDMVIEKNDLLSITVNSINPEASRIFNLPNQTEIRSTTPTGQVVEPSGYLVDKDGMIRFLMLDAIKAEGLTKKQLQDLIKEALIARKLLLNPVVEVRLLNYKITVLGEVTRPTVITVPSEKITLLEALGLAGDVTLYGKRNNILIIREEAGIRTATRINLNSTELFNSPFYYLRSNDVIYIEPNKARVAGATRIYQLLPTIVSSFSIVILVLDRIAR